MGFQSHMIAEDCANPECKQLLRAGELDVAAMLHQTRGKAKEAEAEYLEAAQIRSTILGNSHPHTAASYKALLQLYDQQGTSAFCTPYAHCNEHPQLIAWYICCTSIDMRPATRKDVLTTNGQ